MDKFDVTLELSKKLNWGKMMSQIALPAIDAIIDFAHHIGITDEYLLTLDGNDIFGLLAGDVTAEDCEKFISLRCEIEEYMMNGDSYTEAISEWWK